MEKKLYPQAAQSFIVKSEIEPLYGKMMEVLNNTRRSES